MLFRDAGSCAFAWPNREEALGQKDALSNCGSLPSQGYLWPFPCSSGPFVFCLLSFSSLDQVTRTSKLALSLPPYVSDALGSVPQAQLYPLPFLSTNMFHPNLFSVASREVMQLSQICLWQN